MKLVLGDCMKIVILLREIFLVREMSNFVAAGQNFSPICQVSPNSFGEGAGTDSPYMVSGNKKD